MSRKIQFRHFDMKNDVMVYQKDNEVWSFSNDDENTSLIIRENHKDAYKTQVWMQSTDSKTESGDIIYEGDILKIDLSKLDISGLDKTKPLIKIGKVVWDDEESNYRIEWKWNKHQYFYVLGCESGYFSEIVGNIYENPGMTLSDGNLWS